MVHSWIFIKYNLMYKVGENIEKTISIFKFKTHFFAKYQMMNLNEIQILKR